jgi:hypothetical protein
VSVSAAHIMRFSSRKLVKGSHFNHARAAPAKTQIKAVTPLAIASSLLQRFWHRISSHHYQSHPPPPLCARSLGVASVAALSRIPRNATLRGYPVAVAIRRGPARHRIRPLYDVAPLRRHTKLNITNVMFPRRSNQLPFFGPGGSISPSPPKTPGFRQAFSLPANPQAKSRQQKGGHDFCALAPPIPPSPAVSLQHLPFKYRNKCDMFAYITHAKEVFP